MLARAGRPSGLLVGSPAKETALSTLFSERLKGLEPSTFCMASRRSSQLSYSREKREYTCGPRPMVATSGHLALEARGDRSA